MKTLINTLYSMNLTINERIAALRTHIAQENIQAFIIPSTDPHLSEYVAPHWQSREWISGFTGSAGTVVITAEEAGLWTDSRYFLQAARQIEGTEITLYKEMLPETPSIPAFLNSRLQEGDTVGIDGKMFGQRSGASARSIEKEWYSCKKRCRPPATVMERPPGNAIVSRVYSRHTICRQELYGETCSRPKRDGRKRC